MNDAIAKILTEFESEPDARVVLRWIDECRPVPNETGGYTVANVKSITLTGMVAGSLRREIFVGLGRAEFRQFAAGRKIQFIERDDNIVR